MSCARICSCAAVCLVLLRLAVGWHFFMEGAEKLTDPNFSSAGFLLQAKGPLADFYHSQVPGGHDWQRLLAKAQRSDFLDPKRVSEVNQWQAAYDKSVKDALEKKKDNPEVAVPFKISELKPYDEWAEQIVSDWQDTLQQFRKLPALTPEFEEHAAAEFDARRRELIVFLDGVEGEIAKYQHLLMRIERAAQSEAAGQLAFHDDRIAEQRAKAATNVSPWLAGVATIEDGYHRALRKIYRDAEQAAAERPQTVDESTESETQADGEQASGDATADDSAFPPQTPPQVIETPTDQQAASPTDQPQDEQTTSSEGDQGPSDADGNEASNDDKEGAPPSPGEPTQDQPADDDTVTDADTPDQSRRAPTPALQPAMLTLAAVDAPADGQQEPEKDQTKAKTSDVLTIDDVLTSSRQANLKLVDTIVSWLTIAVGACLIVGLFTPLAGFAGALFLATVISTQPPWVPGAQETYYQFVEMFALMVLGATCAGRWVGLDYFFACLFGRFRRRNNS